MRLYSEGGGGDYTWMDLGCQYVGGPIHGLIFGGEGIIFGGVLYTGFYGITELS